MDCKKSDSEGKPLTGASDNHGVDVVALTVNQTLNDHARAKTAASGVLTLKADSVTNDGQRREMPPPSRQDNSQTADLGRVALAASGGVNNRSGGVLISRNALNVSTATLVTRARIQGGGGVSLNATDRLQENDGKSSPAVTSHWRGAGAGEHRQRTGTGCRLLLDVVNTVNGGRVLATGSADVKGTTLNNTGTLQGADLLVNCHTFSNSGTLLGTSGLGVKGSSLLKMVRAAVQCRQPADAQTSLVRVRWWPPVMRQLKLIAALTNHGTLAAGKTLCVTSQNAITNGGVMRRVMPWCSVPERRSPALEC